MSYINNSEIKSTSQDWWDNAISIKTKVELTFLDGSLLTLSDSDYIVSFNIRKNIIGDKDKPIFNLIADSLELTLLSLNNEFNPYANGKYSKKIKAGVKIKLYSKAILPNNKNLLWDKLGTFFINECKPGDDNNTINIYGLSKAQDILMDNQIPRCPLKIISNKQDINDFITVDLLYDFEVKITSYGNSILPQYIYTLETRKETLYQILKSTFSYIVIDDNILEINTFNGEILATLKDSNCIISLSPTLSLNKKYNKSNVPWYINNVLNNKEVANISHTFNSGDNSYKTFKNISIGKDPVYTIENILIESEDSVNATLTSAENFTSNSVDVTISSRNGNAGYVSIRIFATIFSHLLTNENDKDNNIYIHDSIFIQSDLQAKSLQDKIDKFLSINNQYCSANIKFNPLIDIGKRIYIDSNKYEVKLDGYVVSNNISLSNGQYRQEILVLNKEAVK